MKKIELANGVEFTSLPETQQRALKNAHAYIRRFIKEENVDLPMLWKLEEIYKRIDEARKQLLFMQQHPKAIASIYNRMFSQLHRLLNGAEDKAFNSLSWENYYRTDKSIARLEQRLFLFEQVIFWISQELSSK